MKSPNPTGDVYLRPVQRRPVPQSSNLDVAEEPAQSPPPSENVSQSGESPPAWPNEQTRALSWETTSQVSTTGGVASSVASGPASRERSTSYSTAATSPSVLAVPESVKSKRLGSFYVHLDKIRKYEPESSSKAAQIWAASASKAGLDIPGEDEAAEDGSYHNIWAFWETMSNTADALATATYLQDAFDLHHTCFMQIFSDTGQRLLHWEPLAENDGQNIRDRKTSRVIAGTTPVLQLLVRAAVGVARSCTTSDKSELARIMLDAALSVVRQTKYATRVRALAILFDLYKNTLLEVWPGQNNPTPSPSTPKSARLEQEYSLDDLHWFVHPAIINREFLFLSTYLLELLHKRKTYSILPARFTAWDKPVADFVTKLAVPSKVGQAWLELVKDRVCLEPYDFIESYMGDAKSFLRWCTTTIFEGQTMLDDIFADEDRPSRIVSRDALNEARLALFWFLISRRKSLEAQTSPIQNSPHSGNNALPKFSHHSDTTSAATLDAFMVLSSFIFGFCTPEPLPTSLQSISQYALLRLNQIKKWPYGFVWHYLQHTVSFATKMHTEGDFVQDNVDQKYVDFAILGVEPAQPRASVQLAVELHPQPLPEFIIQSSGGRGLSSTNKHHKAHKHHKKQNGSRNAKVTFMPVEQPQPPTTSSSKPTSKKRWYQRLSLSSIEMNSLQKVMSTGNGDKSNTTAAAARADRSSSPSLAPETRASQPHSGNHYATGGLRGLNHPRSARNSIAIERYTPPIESDFEDAIVPDGDFERVLGRESMNLTVRLSPPGRSSFIVLQ